MEDIQLAIAKNRNKKIFFIINLLLIVYYFIHTPSLIGGIIACVINVLLFLRVLSDNRSDQWATSDIAYFFFADLLTFIGINVNELVLYFGNNFSKQFDFDVSFDPGFGIIIAIGAVAFFLGMHGIINAVGASIVLFSIIYLEYGFNHSPYISNTCFAVMIISLALYWLWFYLTRIIETTSNDNNSIVTRISIGLITIQILMLFFEKDFIITHIQKMAVFITESGEIFIPWWKLLVFEIIIICGVIQLAKVENGNRVDTLILMSVGFIPILLKTLVNSYFSYNAFLVILFAFILLKCTDNERYSKKTFQLDNIAVLGICMCIIPIVANLIEHDLLGVVIVTASFSCVYYFKFLGKKAKEQPVSFWLCILCNILCEAIAYIFSKKFHFANITILMAAFVFSIILMIVINWPHPKGITASVYSKIAICVCYTLICLIPLFRYGVNVKIDKSNEKMTLLSTTAYSQNSIENSTSYVWEDRRLSPLNEKKKLIVSSSEISIESECLYVSATDSKGVITHYRSWYPYYFINFLRNVIQEINQTQKKFENYLFEHYCIDVMSSEIPDDSPMTFVLPEHGKRCVIQYDKSNAVSSSDIKHIKVRVVNEADRNCDQYFNVIINEEKQVIELILNKVPKKNVLKCIIDGVSDSGEVVCSSTFNIVTGSRDEVIVVKKNFDVENGKYTIKNKNTKLFVSYSVNKDDKSEYITMKKNGFVWTVEKSSDNYYQIYFNHNDANQYLFGYTALTTPIYLSDKQYSDWQICECWVPGTGRAWALAIDMKNVNKNYGLDTNNSKDGIYYLRSYESEITFVEEKSLDKSCLWSLSKK